MNDHVDRLTRVTPFKRENIKRALERAALFGASNDEAANAVEIQAQRPWLAFADCVEIAKSTAPRALTARCKLPAGHDGPCSAPDPRPGPPRPDITWKALGR